jgi:hypothetical protein
MRWANRASFGFLAPLVLALAACAPPPPTPQFPEPSYGHLGAIRLDVARFEIVVAYEPPLAAPNVEHTFPTTPAAAAERWAQDRIQAVGDAGWARFIVHEAGVTETALERESGLKGAFTDEQSERYEGVLDVVLEIRSDRGFRDAHVEATATRTQSVSKDITVNERRTVFFEMTEALMVDLNAQLEARIREHLAKYLR